MRKTRTALITAIAIGLLAGSAVGVAAQDDPETTGEQATSDVSEFNEYERYTILAGELWYCQKKGKGVVVWDETQRAKYKKKQCTKTSLDTGAHIDIEATDAVLHAGESVSEAVEFGNLNLLDPPLSHAHADVFFSCREVLAMVGFVHDVVAQDAESGTTGTDESQWSTLSSDRVFVEAVEEVVAPCKEAINIASPPSTSSAG